MEVLVSSMRAQAGALVVVLAIPLVPSESPKAPGTRPTGGFGAPVLRSRWPGP